MLIHHQWQTQFTIVIVALYSGAFLSQEILKRRSEFYSEIQQQEKRYTSLVENMNDGFIYLDADQNVTFVNEKFCNILGYTSEEVMDRNTFDLNEFFGNNNSENLYVQLSKDEIFRNEFKLQKKNGDTIWVQMSAAPYIDEEKHIGSLVVCTDITTLKNVQESLKKREEGYRSFIDQSAVGIWRADYKNPIPVSMPVEDQVHLLIHTGFISECNDCMAKMYGYDNSTELTGRLISDFYFIENNFDEERTKKLISRFISNNYRIINSESKEIDKNGEIRYMLNNNIGIIENGFLIRTWGVQTDITERKKTEKELRETNQELDTFFYKSYHDLKGPLASIMGVVNLARLEFPDHAIDKYFGMIEKSVKRLDNTLMDLIVIAKTRKGGSKLMSINLNVLVDEILSSLKHFPGFSKVDFEVKIDPALEIISDRVLMLSVYQNLIQNAINYCNQQSPKVRIKIIQIANGIEFEITDNGNGITEEVRPRIFEMFYRGHPDSTGSGLGLFIVKNALEKLKGTVSFESKAGETVFRAFIPESKLDA
jgi:PAS domain S-box-containing protein